MAARRMLLSAGVPLRGETLVVGLSGGADSVALLDTLEDLGHSLGYRVVAAHLDHNLRADSADDAAFCQDLCARLGVELRLGSAQVRERAAREGGGLEEAARLERYGFLRRIKDLTLARAIAVAHTRDDQAETFLLRLLRGAGGSGLASMRGVSADLLRPFLGVERRHILDHLAARDLPFREDPTNADPTWVRNRVRHELLPYLESRFNPQIRDVLARTAALLDEEDRLLSEQAHEAFSVFARRDGDGLVVSRRRLHDAPEALARRVVREALGRTGGLRGVSALHVEKILEVASSAAPSGRKLPLPGGREAVFRFDAIRIGPRRAPIPPFALPLPVPGRVVVPGGFAVTAQSEEGPPVSTGWEAVVATPVDLPLVVRSARPGERVKVKGRERSLSRFLMEKRVPADLRHALPLVVAGDRVLFVPGGSVDAAFENTERHVRIAVGAP
jgi:tRNA(Ile)-lysidine synthase